MSVDFINLGIGYRFSLFCFSASITTLFISFRWHLQAQAFSIVRCLIHPLLQSGPLTLFCFLYACRTGIQKQKTHTEDKQNRRRKKKTKILLL